MAYGLKYYFVDKKLVGSTSTTYTFEILEDGYSGSTTEWRGIDIQRQYEELSFRRVNNIQKSSCTGVVRVIDETQRTALETIAGSEIGDYKVQLKRDSSVIWTGLIVPDLTIIGEQNYGNQSASLVAKDLFFTGNFPLTTLIPDTRGIEKAIVLIADILDNLGYGLDIVSYTSWIENGLTQTDDILNQSYHEKERFRIYGESEGEDDKPLTNQQALEYILKAYGLILRQVDGDWNLMQITAFDNPASVRRYVYNSSGIQTSSSTSYSLASSAVSSELYVLGNSSNNYIAGVKTVKSVFEHESIIQGIKFNREYWIDDGSEISKSQYWQADGTGNLELSFTTWFAKTTAIDLGNPVVMTVSIYVDTGGSDYYWNGSSWTTTPSTIAVEVQETYSTTDSDGNYVHKNSGISIVTDPIPDPADGTLYVKLTPDALQPNYAYWYFRDVQFNLKYSDTVDGISSAINYELEQTGGYSDEYEYGAYYFGDGPTSASLSALKNSSRALLSQWKRAGDVSTTNHQNLVLNEILNVRRNQRRNIRATLYGEYEPDNILSYDSTNFFFLGGSWSSSSYIWNANFIELNVQTGTDTLTTYYITDGSGTSSGAVGSTGGSTGASSLYLEKGQNLSDVPNKTSARTNLGLGTGDDVTFNTVTADFIGDLTGAIHVQGKNDTGGTLTKGTPVYISGQVAEGQQFTIDVADSDGSGTMPAIGILSADVNDNAQGDIVTHGKLIGIDTSSFTVGDELFIGSSGTLVNTPPTGESNLLQKIAKVVRVDASSGQIYIMGAGRTNAVPNLDEGKIFAGDANNQAVTTNVIDVNIASNLVTINNDLTVTGVVRTNELDAQADLVWNTATEIWNTSDYYFTGAINLAGSLYITDELDVAESVSVGTTLDVSGNTTLGGTLDVTGNSTIGGTLDITSNTTIGGSLTLSGSADFNSTMNLQGNLTTQANLADDGFSEGWAGTNWQIQADGSAEFEEMRIRGALRVYEFIAKQISTIGGSEILSIAQGKVESAGSGEIVIDNVDGSTATSFSSGDLWIAQTVDINTGTVTSVHGLVDSVLNNVLTVTVESGSLADLEQGNLIVAYGSTSDADRQAIMYRNVDRSEDNLIMRLQTGVNEFSKLQAEANTRVAFGDLNGYSGLSTETFGFFAGDNSNEHILVTDGGLFLKDGSTTLAQLTSNTFKVGDGTNFLSFNGTTFDIQTDTFNLDTTNLDISSANENIVIGTSPSLITIGKLSSVEQGIKLDTSGISNQNYWRLGQGNVQFKLGDGTNKLEFNELAGTFEISVPTFTLDATDASGGIKVESANQRIQLEDADRVRTQVDVNDGTFSLTETSEYDANDATVITQGTPFTSSAFQTTKGDSLYIDVSAELTSLGSDGTEAYIQVEALGSTSSGGTYTSFASFLGPVLTSTGNSGTVRFSAHSYSYDYIKIKITVFSNDTALNAQFELDQNIIVKSYDSQTRLSLDGLFVNNNTKQYARLTRSENELSGIIKMKNLPTADPQVAGVIYNDGGTLKISAG